MKSERFRLLLAGLALGLGGAIVGASGCSTTEFYNEGPGQPSDRARGSVPAGTLGVCKRPFTRKPPIVSESLWDHAKPCTSKTPESYVRLGYGHIKFRPDAVRKVEKVMEALREGPREDRGNATMLAMLRAVREEGENDPWLKDRISKNSSRTAVCDFTYLLNTMEREVHKLQGDRCAAEAYDPKLRTEVCLFDTSKDEATWLTSAWACVTQTGELGREQSCHRLCAYDDYCSRQVSCAAPDIDLVLCAMGVCLPEKRAGIF